MKALIVAAAGMSTLFSRSLGRECLKCLYYKNSVKESLLYRMLAQPAAFDRYIIIGGYKFQELKEMVESEFQGIQREICLVYNEKFSEYGSGYSLFLGLKKALELCADEVVFAEGDLYVDRQSYMSVYRATGGVVTCNNEPISADRSVAFYFDRSDKVHYIYDTGHNALVIEEPFLSIYNSGQVWKFSDMGLWKEIIRLFGEKQWEGTNLVPIEAYFNRLGRNHYEVIQFRKWVNCNTVADFEAVQDIAE